MSRCSAIKANGELCRVPVEPGAELCWAHDPQHADKRRRITSKAGKSKPSRDLQGVRAQLQQLADSVLDGEVDRADASVAEQLLNIKLRTIEVERRLKETEELERRLEELEESIEQNNQNNGGSRAWG